MRTALLSVLFALVSISAFAATCASLVVPDVNPGGNGTSIDCTVGPLEFSNFSYANSGNDPAPMVDLTGVLTGTGSWGLVLNPNLTGIPPQDITLVFEITSSVPIAMVSLWNQGSQPSSIQEVVCDATGATLLGQCNDITPLANFSAGAEVISSAAFAPATTIWIWKDIGTNTQNGADGHISSFQQNFFASGGTLDPPGVDTPEPVAMSLMGVGLLGLGLLHRRRPK